MGDHTTIEWVVALADARGAIPTTWNPVLGCSRASEGCRNCYAAAISHRFGAKGKSAFAGLTDTDADGVPRFNGTIRVQDHLMSKPLSWRKRRVVFVGDMADIFHPGVSDDALNQIFAVMALAQDHLFLLLTKRPERMREYLSNQDRDEAIGWEAHSILDAMHREDETKPWPKSCDPSAISGLIHGASAKGSRFQHREMWPLPNVWLGATVEDQDAADERIPHILATPAAKRFVSYEPALGPVEWAEWIYTEIDPIEWVIVGGESGPHARPMHPDWARDARDKCKAAGVPFFFKQWGEWAPHTKSIENGKGEIPTTPRGGVNWHSFDGGVSGVFRVGKRAAGRLLDGHEWNEVPE